jgi:hypothetical protein
VSLAQRLAHWVKILRGDGKRWRIEGKGKESARLAVAVLDGDGFAYIIQEQN